LCRPGDPAQLGPRRFRAWLSDAAPQARLLASGRPGATRVRSRVGSTAHIRIARVLGPEASRMTVEAPRGVTNYLASPARKPADAAAPSPSSRSPTGARSTRQTGRLVESTTSACGSGAMGRWLAPLLPARHTWVEHEPGRDCLAPAAANLPRPAANGAAVTVRAKAFPTSPRAFATRRPHRR